MQRRVLLMRHAKSSRDDASLSDHQRPLNARGIKDASKMARVLQKLNLIPSRVLVSDSKRTLETLDGIKSILGELPTQAMNNLYLASANTLLECMDETAEGETMLIISHNPGTELVMYEVTGEYHSMPTTACALLIGHENTWHCQQVLRPKDLSHLCE